MNLAIDNRAHAPRKRLKKTRLTGSGSSGAHQPDGGHRDDPRSAGIAAVLATLGFLLTFLLIAVGSSPQAVCLAAAIAMTSLILEIHLLSRLP
ncbi:hypothetical protein LH935_27995 (plasmid) [Gordonia polyisoprenivorans]|uniref:hypothetical protein n=1 Tax=Gordonia polyisoprenivorans TaxID=84595 RepID=UPI00223439C0|nr:hypothetical protein [uncultured Gordonia sp.]UZF59334.1 hypothetical protein LH935_27995 [Gordonia polyisoprenivorans]